MSGDNKSPLDSFNEIPSWYDEPELDPEQADPNVVPPKHSLGGHTTGMGYVVERQSTAMSGGTLGMIIFGLLALAMGGFAVLALTGSAILGSGDAQDIAVGDCVAYRASNNLVGHYAVSVPSCDPEDLGTVGAEDVLGRAAGVIEYDQLEEFPDTDEFWAEAVDRCQAMAISDNLILPFPQAESNSDWADGERTIVCHISPVFTAEGRPIDS